MLATKKIAAALLVISTVTTGCASQTQIDELKLQVSSLQNENAELKAELDSLKNGAQNLIYQIRTAYEANNSDEVLKLADQLHQNYNGSPEDVEAQKCVASINKARQEEAAKKQAEAAEQAKAKAEENVRKAEEIQKSRQEQLRSLIRVTDIYPYNMDMYGGTDLVINFVNNSDKQIKYVYFTCQPYNAVNDPVSCTIQINPDFSYRSEHTFTATGPYNKGEGMSGTSRLWSKAWYNSTIDTVKLKKIEIEYMDGTKETISGENECNMVIY